MSALRATTGVKRVGPNSQRSPVPAILREEMPIFFSSSQRREEVFTS
ncbi:MAG: hypothetical protein BWY86_01321 [Candidatus Aminicenantes bacterium ADurb.Bin508]|nr:MAG: hypothetical protein BWY86_01321 [Candidatus Aminicenantes bacterium ADurb.Bin508]